MKKITLLAALMVCATFAFAQVTEGTIRTGNFVNYNGDTIQGYGIDFDNDSILEVAIKTGVDPVSGYEWTTGAVEYVFGKVQILVVDTSMESEMFDKFDMLEYGENVNSTGMFGGFGDGMFADYSKISTDSTYVGFSFTKGGSTYYAYAKVHGDIYEVVWDEVYYEATAGTGINAGAKPQPQPSAVENVNAEENVNVRMVAIEGRIYVERDGKLFDLNGRQVR